MSGIFEESLEMEIEDDVTLDESTETDGFECELEGCSTKECDDPVKEEDDMDDDYEPDEDDVLDVEESMLFDDAFDVFNSVHEADDASVEDINAYEKSREEFYDGNATMKDVEDLMDDQLGDDMVVSDDLDILGVNTDDFVVVPDSEL